MEQLLKPRYKVIADWPGSTHKVGEIYSDREFGTGWKQWNEKYPHLFRKLEWWEERKPEEMPEYLRWGKLVLKNPSYNKTGFYADGVGWIDFTSSKEIIPTTLEEYNEYLKTKQP